MLSRVGRLSKHLDRARRQAFAASGVEPWEFDVLAALRRAGAPYQLSPKALLQQTLVSSGTMTNRIDRLVERRLVERRTDPHDGRGVLAVMTGEGPKPSTTPSASSSPARPNCSRASRRPTRNAWRLCSGS